MSNNKHEKTKGVKVEKLIIKLGKIMAKLGYDMEITFNKKHNGK